jgi:hypothetical protein
MISKEKIIEILHSHSYYVEDQAGNHLIVVDDDSWDEIAEQVKNFYIPNVNERYLHINDAVLLIQSMPASQAIQKMKSMLSGQPDTLVVDGELLISIHL